MGKLQLLDHAAQRVARLQPRDERAARAIPWVELYGRSKVPHPQTVRHQSQIADAQSFQITCLFDLKPNGLAPKAQS
jgi:hypothetical protein